MARIVSMRPFGILGLRADFLRGFDAEREAGDAIVAREAKAH
jgi:hypothetical protein